MSPQTQVSCRKSGFCHQHVWPLKGLDFRLTGSLPTSHRIALQSMHVSGCLKCRVSCQVPWNRHCHVIATRHRRVLEYSSQYVSRAANLIRGTKGTSRDAQTMQKIGDRKPPKSGKYEDWPHSESRRRCTRIDAVTDSTIRNWSLS